MSIKEFERELKKIDRNLAIVVNEKIPALAGVYYSGEFIVGCPSGQIFNEKKKGYGIELPNGTWVDHRGRLDVLVIVNATVTKMKHDPDYADAVLGRGQYSDKKLGIEK